MNKKKYLTIGLSLMMLLALAGCNSKDSSTSSKHEDIFIDAKTDSYQTIEELEKASDLIVIGTKIKELESNVLYDENGVYQVAYTYSSFNIDEIIKNDVNELNKEIKIFENQAYDKKTNKTLHIAGYTNMIGGNKYILYLSLSDGNYYIPLAVTIGKVPLSKSEINGDKLKMKNNYEVSIGIVDKLHKEIQNKYSNKIV